MDDANSVYNEANASLPNEGNTTTTTTTGINGVDSLLSGVKWDSNVITYSFPTSGSQYSGYSSGEEPYLNFVPLNLVQQNAARDALAKWASVCNLTFTETTGGNGTILFGTSSLPSTSWAYYPSTGDWGGDVWFGNSNSNAPTNPVVGSYSYATYIHEIGHALGLKHPHDLDIYNSGTIADSSIDSVEYSIMSYRSYVGADLNGYTIADGSYPTSLMMYDIAAIQQMYGANYSYNSGNTVYKFDPNQTKIFETIWDGGGNDTYDLSAYTANLKIDLSPGGWSIFNSSQLADLGNGHYARGSVANALLYKGDTRSLIENAIGGSGNDSLIGNQVDNVLNGGLGADTMAGGVGNDNYVVDNISDVVIENAGEGTDTVQSIVTYTLGDNVENLILIGIGSINGTGNALNNSIIGNNFNNTLNGGAGDDTLDGSLGADIMTGGVGNDSYVVDDIGDVIVENFGQGVDTVYSKIATYTLSANVENLIISGIINCNGVGNELNNRINGNSGANLLDGGLGADILIGGAGNDSYVVDNVGDIVVENDVIGIDTVYSNLANYALGANIENLILTGPGSSYGVGNELNNSLTGNSGDDRLDGGLGADTLIGGAGNDSYVVDNIGDIIKENNLEGTDTVYSNLDTYTLAANVENLNLSGISNSNGIGNELNNSIIGNNGNNTLSGGAGDDTLDGGLGADTMIGGAGNDTYVVDNSLDVIVEVLGGGIDTVQSNVTYILSANVENLMLTGGIDINGAGNVLNNAITGTSGNNLLDGGIGSDTLYGGAGNDTYVVDNALDVVVENVSEGLDIVQSSVSYILSANIENLVLTGIGSTNGTGNTLNNVITGNSGNNILDGDAGVDTLYGGSGNDTYIVDNALDVVVENAAAGIDMVLSSIAYTLDANLENLTLTGTDSNNGTGNELSNVIVGNSGNNILDGGLGTDTMKGGAGDDTYIVDTAFDVIVEAAAGGTDGVQAGITYVLGVNIENLTLTGISNISGTGNSVNNVITGNSGDNSLNGLLGADTLIGGAGNDTYIVDNIADVIVENAGAGTDTVQSSVSYTLGANVENLTLTGSAVSGTGNERANLITGNSLNNILDGGLGADILAGGLGNDTYVVNDGGDTIIENLSAGTDTVQSSISYTLGANLENLTLTGTNNLDGIGNSLNNIITGNSLNNQLDGGLGADNLIGGLGDDTYIVDNTGDIVSETLNAGTDLVQSSVNYVLSANVENLTLVGIAVNGTGNSLSNVITGNSLSNILSGGAGADTLIGGAGNDTYLVDQSGDVITESLNEGTDVVQSSAASYTLGANVENLTLTGSAVSGTGNELANTITGNSLNNILDGGLGADTLIGGLGNDTYVVDSIGDIVTENLSAGTDTVQSSISYTLGANLENLTLTGTANLDGTGNNLNNILIGNSLDNKLDAGAGNDTLDGGLGADTLIGGLGNDTYVVDDSGDIVTENLNAGTDSVQSSISYTLGANLENLTLTGTANVDGTGNSLNNIITGNSLNNQLDGGVGADTLIGGLGDDTYIVDNTGDIVSEALNAGTDLVQSSVNYVLSANVENLTLVGTAVNGTGNSLGNVITGNSLSNILSGGAGADTLIGGVGNDTYLVDQSGDVITEALNEGTDVVQSSAASYTLGANVENLTLTGSAVSGTGNELANTITGNSLSNILDGGLGADNLAGGLGNDTYVVDDGGDTIIENLSAGTDTVQSSISYTLGANLENLTLTGTGSLDGTGNSLNNILTGNSLNNQLNGGAGADTLIGGLGDDTYFVDNVGDIVSEALNAGTDLVQSTVNYVLSANIENLTLGGSAVSGTGNSLDNVITGSSLNNILSGGIGSDTLVGGIGNDTYLVDQSSDVVIEAFGEGTDLVQSSAASYTLVANVENLTLTGIGSSSGTGNTLNNVITGNSGNNILDGGAGNDTLYGGAGNDSYIVDNVLDIIVENAAAGIDTVLSNVSYTLGANLENLTLTGADSNNGTGNALNNVIVGNSGNNILNGLLGADTMIGGAGDDIYVVDNTFDVIAETVNGGTDTVESSATYMLSADIENLTLTGIGNINGTGNNEDNVIIGNGGNNVLNGGNGADELIGGLGNDTYIVDNDSDIVEENFNEGTDLVQSNVSYTLGSNVENLTLTGTVSIDGTGNSDNNVITGNSLNNILNGGLGADKMIGGAGNDTYVVDNSLDVVVEALGGGIDTVQTGMSYALNANVENLTLLGTDNINGTGNELSNVIFGTSGNNILNGGLGADRMIGGAGNDTYMVDNALDVIVEYTSEGIDTVQSSILYTLGSNVENLTLIGAGSVAGYGNELDNVITGNSGSNILQGNVGNDTLYGGAGNDTLYGGAGNDVLDGGLGNDTYIFGSGLGNDTINSFVGSNLNNGFDSLQFQNVLSTGVGFTKDSYDLICTINQTGETIRLSNWLLGTNYQVDQFKFGDITLTAAQINQKIV